VRARLPTWAVVALGALAVGALSIAVTLAASDADKWPGWLQPYQDWRTITWSQAERAKGQAWDLKTIESFHSHGTHGRFGCWLGRSLLRRRATTGSGLDELRSLLGPELKVVSREVRSCLLVASTARDGRTLARSPHRRAVLVGHESGLRAVPRHAITQ
jgi:hypothetical protein